MDSNLSLNPNRIVTYLQKPSHEFTKADLIDYVKGNGIRLVKFMYPADDHRLKSLNYVINSESYLDSILSYG